jgi:hypothetical protein
LRGLALYNFKTVKADYRIIELSGRRRPDAVRR